MTTSVCVESTLRDAMVSRYRCLLLADCAAEPSGANESRTTTKPRSWSSENCLLDLKLASYSQSGECAFGLDH